MRTGENEREAPRASFMPENKEVPHTYEQPERRTVYSKNPRICKHQFGNGSEPFCRYCATTNPSIRMSFNELS